MMKQVMKTFEILISFEKLDFNYLLQIVASPMCLSLLYGYLFIYESIYH